jgi:hypothetical protein
MASTADACRRLAQACESADFAGAVQIMREHASCAAVLQAGCEALTSIARGTDDEPRVRLVAAGAVDVVLVALEMHPENASLQANCLALLKRIATAQYGVPSVVAARAAEAAVAALRAHAAVPMVQFYGCQVRT